MSSRQPSGPLFIDCDDFADLTVIRGVIWCASQPTSETGHWRMNFELARRHPSGAVCVSVDMMLPKKHIFQGNEAVNQYGQLKITPQPTLTSKKQTLLDVNADLKRLDITVKNLVDLIVSKGLQYYKFHPQSSGCLFWQQNFLRLLIAQGWVEPRSASKLETAIEKYRDEAKQNERIIPYPAVPGQFYDPTTLPASSV